MSNTRPNSEKTTNPSRTDTKKKYKQDNSVPPPPSQPVFLTLPEIASRWRISRNGAHKFLKDYNVKKLPLHKIRVPLSEIKRIEENELISINGADKPTTNNSSADAIRDNILSAQ